MKDNGETLLVDGDNALGQVSAGFAMTTAIEMPTKSGMANNMGGECYGSR